MSGIPHIKLNFQFSTKRQTLLKSRGVDGGCFASARNKFDVNDSIVRMKPEIKNIMNKGISVKKQLNSLSRLLANPLRGAPVIGIGSFPTDNRAKLVALNIMDAAIRVQTEEKKNRKLAGKNYPKWHRVYGGLGDPIRDKAEWDNPTMLILSNIGTDSTAMKIEKVRDLLVKYDSIPRIVVVHGCDPMKFFAEKLYYPMNYGFYVGSDNKTAALEF